MNPGIPSTPSAVEIGAAAGSSRRSAAPSESAHSRQPSWWSTQSPSAYRGFRDAATRPTAPPVIASPSVNGATYERTSFMRGRMYGSTEKYAFRMST